MPLNVNAMKSEESKSNYSVAVALINAGTGVSLYFWYIPDQEQEIHATIQDLKERGFSVQRLSDRQYLIPPPAGYEPRKIATEFARWLEEDHGLPVQRFTENPDPKVADRSSNYPVKSF